MTRVLIFALHCGSISNASRWAPGIDELTVQEYGIYYTGLIASIYLPAHKSLTDVGHLLAERLIRERQAAHAWLGLQGSVLQEIQQGLSVLTPLLASISSLILDSDG